MCDMDFAVRMGLIWDEGMRKVGTVTGKGGVTGDGSVTLTGITASWSIKSSAWETEIENECVYDVAM